MHILSNPLYMLEPRNYFIVLTILLFIVTIFLTLKRLKDFGKRWRSWALEFNLPGDRILWGCIGLLTVLYLVSAGNAAVGWDAAVHHYAFPKALLRAGHLIDVPGIPFSFYPSLGEMLFTFGLGIDGEFLAGSMTWVFLFPLFAGMLSIGRSLGNPRIGLWGLVLFLGAPLTTVTPYSGVIDLPFFTYCILAVAVLLDGEGDIPVTKIILTGLLVGFACATKHLGLLFLAAFIPIIIWRVLNGGGSIGKAIKAGLIITFFSFLIPLPWYIRALLATGDPLYPFLSNIMNIAGAENASFSVESFARTEYPRTLAGYIFYLWHLTMDYQDLRPWYLAIHPAWLAMLPPAIFWAFKPADGNRKEGEISRLRMLLVLGLLVLTINFFLAPAYPRYIFPTWLCLSLTSAWTLMEIRRMWPWIGKVLIAVSLAMSITLVMGIAGKRAIEVVPQYFSGEAQIEALTSEFPGIETMLWANENINPERSLVLSTDPKIYYLDAPAIIAKPGIESSLMVPWDSEPEEIISNWRQLGVTHFILDTTLLSVKHGFGIAFFSSVLSDRNSVWLDITTTRAGAEEFGIGDILTDEEFLYMSELGGLPVVEDGTREGRHLFDCVKKEMFQSWGRDYLMAEIVLRFIEAGILVEEYRSGPGGGIRIYSVNLSEVQYAGWEEGNCVYGVRETSDDCFELPVLPDVTRWGLPYREGPVDQPE